MATYAVGDLQGCLTPLLSLLAQVAFNPARDRLWLAGDLVNRGPESLATLRFVKGLSNSAITVLGNHDLHLLAVSRGYKKANKKDTLESILTAPDRDELLNWLIQQPLLHYDTNLNFAMVHAGIPPAWGLNKALKLAKEVQDVLKSKKADTFFANMYGNEPNKWDDELKGSARLRLITNYLTRMRFCSAKSRIELETKTGPDSAPKGFSPWFHHTNPGLGDTKLIFGHWAALEGKTGKKQFIGLDTGCVWGSRLTALRLEDGEIFTEKCDC